MSACPCPGPAIVDLVAPSQKLITFVIAMMAGMLGIGSRGIWRARVRFRQASPGG